MASFYIVARDHPPFQPGDVFLWSTDDNEALVLADGRKLSVASYPELFEAIGYTYGGEGEQFSIPDLRGRQPA